MEVELIAKRQHFFEVFNAGNTGDKLKKSKDWGNPKGFEPMELEDEIGDSVLEAYFDYLDTINKKEILRLKREQEIWRDCNLLIACDFQVAEM